ncbi:MAG: peptidoglycan DD-metalloendopeptidase family protein [Prevotella sp.]|nr:peptidoglycan DD-metalloendopeptidase family protein [Prevotella sp.]
MKTKKFLICTLSVVFSLTALPVLGQDKMASAAPIDRKAKKTAVIELKKERIFSQADCEDGGGLYETFETRYAHRVTELPETWTIDLRNGCMPTTSRVITSNFGHRWGRQHKGLDIKVYTGDTIVSAWDGKVRIVDYERSGYGKYIVIRHANGLETIYAHLSKHLVKPGQFVKAGETIGLGGNTGRSTGSHLHFETRLCGVALNPILMFDFPEQDIIGDFYVFKRSTYERENRINRREQAKTVKAPAQDSPMALNMEKEADGADRKEVAEGLTENNQPSNNVAEKPKFHTVKRGETLYQIMRTYGYSSIQELCRLNGINKNYQVRAGERIRVS